VTSPARKTRRAAPAKPKTRRNRSAKPRAPAAGPAPGPGGGAGLLQPRPLPSGLYAGYSRFVNLMKLLLPLAAAGLLVALFAWPQIRQTAEGFRLNFAAMPAIDAESMEMVKPRFTGFDSSNRPYTITADTANQLSRESSEIAMERLQADMTMEDGVWLALHSDFGVFDRTGERLDLIGGVGLFHDRGYEIRTESATIDLDAGTVAGDDPVVGQGPFGDMRAEGFRISEQGTSIRLLGASRLEIRPGAELPSR
jgi:lipopolysaccharide export system protein LptC